MLKRGTCGVLALEGGEGYPYTVPIGYVYDGKAVYFHCAKTGHKLGAIELVPMKEKKGCSKSI